MENTMSTMYYVQIKENNMPNMILFIQIPQPYTWIRCLKENRNNRNTLQILQQIGFNTLHYYFVCTYLKSFKQWLFRNDKKLFLYVQRHTFTNRVSYKVKLICSRDRLKTFQKRTLCRSQENNISLEKSNLISEDKVKCL